MILFWTTIFPSLCYMAVFLLVVCIKYISIKWRKWMLPKKVDKLEKEVQDHLASKT